MILTASGIIASSIPRGAVYDPDFQAKLTAAGINAPTDTVYLNAENNLYLNLKNPSLIGLSSGNLYTKTERGYIHAVKANSTYACIEMKSPTTNQANLNNAPTLDEGLGFRGNGTSSNVTYGVPSGIYTQNSAFVLSVVSTWGTNPSSNCLFGTTTGGAANSVWFRMNDLGTNRVYINSNSIQATTDISGTNKTTFMLTRTGASASQFLEKRGVSATTNVVLSSTAPSSSIPTGGLMVLSQNAVKFSTGTASMSFYGQGLTEQEAKDYIAIINTYLIAIGW